MKERPINLSGWEVSATLEGYKTQMRIPYKVKNGQPWPKPNDLPAMQQAARLCPLGTVGDRLWVRETWCETDNADSVPVIAYRAGGCIAIGRSAPNAPDHLIRSYAWTDTPEPDAHGWRPSIHMPRWASRITLEITNVRVERLNEISEADAIAEGLKTLSKDGGQTYKHGIPDVDGLPGGTGWEWAEWDVRPRAAFKRLWESAYGPGSFDDKWVWVIEFRRVEP